MNFDRLEKFFNYKEIYEKDLDIILSNILDIGKSYLNEESLSLIKKTYEYASIAHGNVKRLSGEPYISHPLKVTEFLMDIKPDLPSIQAALLHDVIEDTDYTFEDIKKEFWDEVAQLCEGLVKVSKIKYKWEDRQLETLKKTFLAMAEDLRVIFIKLADRIHNIQTLDHHPQLNKRIKIAEETIKIYVPIAKRLWLYNYQVLLENWCFKILNPDEFEFIIKQYRKFFTTSSHKYSARWIRILTKLLEKEGFDEFSVKWRIKSPYRVFQKMTLKYKSWDFNKVMDLLAFRIITKDITDCYYILWVIHKHYTPLIKKIKDYIALPKFNWYKSIHTTVLWMFNFPIEIQIRTKEMDGVAEYGVAAHFAYSERNKPTTVNFKQSKWIKSLQDLVNAYTSTEQKEDFKDKLKLELLNESTFLYTPKWDVIELPRWSTVLDFAFNIHTDIWLRFKNAIVNGNIVNINNIPNTWDIIEIQVYRNKYTANKHWLDFLNNPSAKWRLTRFLRLQQRESLLKESIGKLNTNLKELKLPLLNTKEDKISKMIDKLTLESKLLEALDQRITYRNIIKLFYPEVLAKYMEKHHPAQNNGAPRKETIKTKNVIVDWEKIFNYVLCPECKPQVGDKIIAKVAKDNIKIHTMTCIWLRTSSFGKLLNANREGEEKNVYRITLDISIDYSINIIDILKLFSDLKVELTQFSTRSAKDKRRIISIEAEFISPGKIEYVINNLKKFGNFVEVIKKKIF